MTTSRHTIYQRISDERDAQDRKWGPPQKSSPYIYLAILIEEIGEIAQELLDNDGRTTPAVQYEIVQSAAVCVKWLETLLDDGVA